MVRSILAIVVGYLITTAIVIVGIYVAAVLMLPPSAAQTQQLTPAYLVVNLLMGLLAAVVGGWVTGIVARRAPVLHGLILGIALLVIGLISGLAMPGAVGGPGWYPYAIPVLGALGAVAGGALQKRRMKAT